jgi:hypothetical protein
VNDIECEIEAGGFAPFPYEVSNVGDHSCINFCAL